jgi:hypothetical protein
MALALRVLVVLGNFLGSVFTFGGLVWALQGLNLLPGTFMKGDLKWTAIGAVTMLVSLGLLAFLNRKPA